MKRPVITLLIVSIVCSAWSVYAQTPDAKAQLPLYKRVDAAIKKGSEKLLSLQKADGSWAGYGVDPKTGIPQYACGPTAIAVYALLESGVGAQDPKIVKALEWLTAQQDKESRADPKTNLMPPGKLSAMTYEVGLRLNCWYLANKQTKGKYKKQLDHDAKLIEDSTLNGANSYTAMGVPQAGDNSVTQYAVLGMWAATRGGYEVELAYWQKCLRHWQEAQRPDGGWCYLGNTDGSPAMTAAGLASMFILFDKLYYKEFRDCKVEANFAAIEKGLLWFDQRFNAIMNGPLNPGAAELYFLYGLERVGLASGYKYFGTNDWFKLGAERILSTQGADGTWVYGADTTVGTSFAMLFLVRGRNSVVFNKLQFDSVVGGGKVDKNDWNCRPRDLAFLTAWINNTIMDISQQINWQIVSINTPVEDWHDAHILYIAGSKAPDFKPADIDKLRNFVLQGGTIFSVSECDSKAVFGAAMKKFYAQMFPDYPMTKMDQKSPIYTLGGTDNQLNGVPELQWITNGIRPLVIHCDVDVAKAWQMNTIAADKKLFQLGANLFYFASDKQPKQRGTFIWPEEVKAKDTTIITVGRVKYGEKGTNWNPEPLALLRLARQMTAQTGHDVKAVEAGVEASKAGDSKDTVLVLSGVGVLKLTADEEAGLKKYVANGGTLVVDAAGGKEEFGRSALTVIEGMWGSANVSPLSLTHKVFNLADPADGVITKLQVRPATRDRMGQATAQMEPKLRCVPVTENGAQRVGVFYSREDITSAGLVGYDSYGTDGYGPSGNWDAAAYRLMRNIVLYAAQKGGGAASQPATTTAPAETPK